MALAEILAIDCDEPINVTLLDGPVEMTATSSGLVGAEARAIRDTYRPDSPGTHLEHSLVVLTLITIGQHRPTRFLVDGVLACLHRKLEHVPSHQGSQSLDDAARRHAIPHLAALFTGPTEQTRGFYATAAFSFVSFLLDSQGKGRFKLFARELRPGHGPAAAQLAFGQSMQAIDKAWRESLGQKGRGGILRFIKLVSPYILPHRLQVAQVLICIAIAVGFTVGLARAQGILLDRALLPRNGHVLAIIMALLAFGFLVAIAVQIRASYLVAVISGKVLRTLRLDMFELVQRLELSFFREVSTGDILARMTTDLDQVQTGLPVIIAQGIRLVLTVTVSVILIFTLDWRLACVALVAIPLIVLTGRIFGPRAAQASIERQQHLARSISTLQENLAAQPVVKSFGLGEWSQRVYAAELLDVFTAGVRLTFISGISGATFTSIGSFTQLTVLGIGGYLVVQGHLSVGSLFAFVALMAQVVGPTQTLSAVLQTVQQASGATERVQELLQATPRIADAPDAVAMNRLSRGITFEDVSFSYSGNEPALQHITLQVPAGALVALVGPSGCGKSTLLNLLVRFYDPCAGQVRFDGTDIRTGTLGSLRDQIGLVLQESVLFNLTIGENIRLGRPSATDAEVEEAARAADIHDAIQAMPDGYDTVVGERGSSLSGGQRQRLAIARAIVRDPAILLLDEATSALDARTEAAINQTLGRISAGRTTIKVTHRLRTAAEADRIVVMDRGMVVDEGSHDELLARGGLYSTLWHDQTGAGEGTLAPGAARLREIPIFVDLPAPLLESVARKLYLERYRAGTRIVEQGDASADLYMIRCGQVEVFASVSVGSPRRLAALGERDHFGEIALLHGTPRTATVVARTELEVYSLTQSDFAVLLDTEPGLRSALERVIDERARRSAEETGAEIGSRTPEG